MGPLYHIFRRVVSPEGVPRESRAGEEATTGPVEHNKAPIKMGAVVGMLRRARTGLFTVLRLLALRNHLYERMTHDLIFRKVDLCHHRVIDQKM